MKQSCMIDFRKRRFSAMCASAGALYRKAKGDTVPPTPIGVLERAREIGLREGLEYVYVGNVHGHTAENTHCPRCGNLLIRRDGFSILRNDIAHGRCIRCGFHIWGTLDS